MPPWRRWDTASRGCLVGSERTDWPRPLRTCLRSSTTRSSRPMPLPPAGTRGSLSIESAMVTRSLLPMRRSRRSALLGQRYWRHETSPTSPVLASSSSIRGSERHGTQARWPSWRVCGSLLGGVVGDAPDKDSSRAADSTGSSGPGRCCGRSTSPDSGRRPPSAVARGSPRCRPGRQRRGDDRTDRLPSSRRRCRCAASVVGSMTGIVEFGVPKSA